MHLEDTVGADFTALGEVGPMHPAEEATDQAEAATGKAMEEGDCQWE